MKAHYSYFLLNRRSLSRLSSLSSLVSPPPPYFLTAAMDAVERVVAQIQGLSGSAADLNNLHVLLKQSEDSLRANFSRLPSFLLQLDTSAHSLGYLYFL